MQDMVLQYEFDKYRREDAMRHAHKMQEAAHVMQAARTVQSTRKAEALVEEKQPSMDEMGRSLLNLGTALQTAFAK